MGGLRGFSGDWFSPRGGFQSTGPNSARRESEYTIIEVRSLLDDKGKAIGGHGSNSVEYFVFDKNGNALGSFNDKGRSYHGHGFSKGSNGDAEDHVKTVQQAADAWIERQVQKSVERSRERGRFSRSSWKDSQLFGGSGSSGGGDGGDSGGGNYAGGGYQGTGPEGGR